MSEVIIALRNKASSRDLASSCAESWVSIVKVSDILYTTGVIDYCLYPALLCLDIVTWIKKSSSFLKSQSIDILSKQFGLSLSFKPVTHQICIAR